MDIEAGEYVRTNNGIIGILLKETLSYPEPSEWEIKTNKGKIVIVECDDYPVKHSHNIIDLIEEGDFVNGFEIEEFDDTEGNIYLGIPIYDDALMDCISEFLPIDKIEIKEILTHEQYESNCYRLED